MTSLLRKAKTGPQANDQRVLELLARKPERMVPIAMANMTARVAWAIMARDDVYQDNHIPLLAA